MKKLILSTLAASALLSLSVQAVPWCHGGTIVQIADVNWSEAQILANFYGSVPPGVVDAEVYKTFHATNNYASTFAGGGGGFGGYSVPGSGTVQVTPYAPYSLTNMVGPGYYFTSQGVKFKIHKCYTIPPMVAVREVERVGLPESGISFEPLRGLEAIEAYWKITDPNNDEDEDKPRKPRK
ncbi:hypothetical protein WG68_08895 [Arsukibacterium ikkense]|uniref:Uncharacterized protein n=1 Tax=Arsukibacterium ikkense TaxID=336831 RepID=A0A0M2V5A6_9GAMM|nr:hypothetical protein [Arsukibacterium ikkense]KKO45816.1 hypothetical protein WG68_08895 [Arsukibacterium ikkense]